MPRVSTKSKKSTKAVSKKSAKKKPAPKKSPPKKKLKKKVVEKDPYKGCSAFFTAVYMDREYLGIPRNMKGLVPYPDKLDSQGREINEKEVNALFIIDDRGYGYGLWPDMDTFLKAVKKEKPNNLGRYRLTQVHIEPAQHMGKFLNGGLEVH